MLVVKAQAALESGDAAFEEEVMHGMWELSVKKAGVVFSLTPRFRAAAALTLVLS